MQTRHVGNNWVPLVCLAVVLLFGGALSMMGSRGNGSAPGFVVFGTLVTAAVSALWWRKNPSWWLAPRNYYYYLAGGTLAGVLLSALIPGLNGAGPWFILGASVGVYGYFERLRLLVTVGSAVSFTAFIAMISRADILGGALHLLAAAILSFAAYKLHVLRHGRRREVQDTDPSFIGSFQEYDEDERVGF